MSPTVRVAEVLFSVTPVTATVAALTVTVQVAFLFPSAVVTVMVAVPAATAVTLPFESTFATLVLLELQLTFLLVAFSGFTVAVKVSVLPTVSSVAVLFRATPGTATVEAVTVTVQVAVLLPSVVVAVIVAVIVDVKHVVNHAALDQIK